MKVRTIIKKLSTKLKESENLVKLMELQRDLVIIIIFHPFWRLLRIKVCVGFIWCIVLLWFFCQVIIMMLLFCCSLRLKICYFFALFAYQHSRSATTIWSSLGASLWGKDVFRSCRGRVTSSGCSSWWASYHPLFLLVHLLSELHIIHFFFLFFYLVSFLSSTFFSCSSWWASNHPLFLLVLLLGELPVIHYFVAFSIIWQFTFFQNVMSLIRPEKRPGLKSELRNNDLCISCIA